MGYIGEVGGDVSRRVYLQADGVLIAGYITVPTDELIALGRYRFNSNGGFLVKGAVAGVRRGNGTVYLDVAASIGVDIYAEFYGRRN